MLPFLSNTGLSFAFLALISGAAMADDAYEPTVVEDFSLNPADQVVDAEGTGDVVPVDGGDPTVVEDFSLNPADQVVDAEGTGDEINGPVLYSVGVDEKILRRFDQGLLTLQDSSVPTSSEKSTHSTCSDLLSQELLSQEVDQAALKRLHCTN